MDRAMLLSPKAQAYAQFGLNSHFGSLRLEESELKIVVQRRVDGKYDELATGEAINVRDIYADNLYLETPNGDAGVFASRFIHEYDSEEHLFEVVGVVATIMLDCDADRDGVVGLDEDGKANWTWGDDGRGAIVLVDNDRDPSTGEARFLDEREPIVVRPTGLQSLPSYLHLVLRTAPEGAMKLSVFRAFGGESVKLLGRAPNEPPQALVEATDDINLDGETLYVAAHEYPGPFFEGLLIINLELVASFEDGFRVLGSDRVMLRVAPWIMTPNTQPARKVYTCEIADGQANNSMFLDGLRASLSSEGLPLEVIPQSIHRGDRWIQDEIEIGYTRSHRGELPVVFDSPRDRGLDAYPEIGLLGSDFGHFVVGGGVPNSLDSFGNLEVSPPVIVDGQVYPLGRIMLGGRRAGDFSDESRQMMAEVRQFLYAQRVQFPFEVYTDWLAVAHVDEIACFVDSSGSEIGFKTLIASPKRVKSVLEDLSREGHGDVLLFEGKRRLDGEKAELSVDAMLSMDDFWVGNDIYQGYLDDTRLVLKRELGIEENDIVDIPVCFQVHRNRGGNLMRTLAFFPDMVNHLVHNDLSIVPKPYGPVVDGKCAFEKAFEDALPDRRVTFIDDWYSYHEMSGEVHCGTNALREPFTVSRWWQVRPEGGFDIKTTGLMGK